MLRKMYRIPADRLHESPFMTRESTVVKRKHRETGKKRNTYAEAIKKRKLHSYETWLKIRHKMDEADLRTKTETNAIADFLSRVMPTWQASKFSHPPPPPPPTLQKMRHRTQTAIRSASVTASPPPPIKEFKYKPPKQERVEEEDDDDEDDDFVEDEARECGREMSILYLVSTCCLT